MASIVGYTKTKIDAIVALLATLASPVFTGNPTAPTPAPGDNDASIATTAFVVLSFAPLASPALTGTPTAPTPANGDNSTKVATTAFIQNGYTKQIVAQAATAYTLLLTDAGKVIESNNASAQTITIPPNSAVAFPIGTVIQITWIGGGKPSVAAGVGVTISSPGGLLGCRVAWSTITLRKRFTDTWILSDDVG